MITSSMETWQQLAERGLQVSSMQNSRVKELVALQQKSQQRRRKGLFVVEGRRELMHCMEGGMELDTVFLCPELLDAAADGVPGGLPGGADVVSVTPQVYAKIAYRGTTEGIMATVRTPELSLLQPQPYTLVGGCSVHRSHRRHHFRAVHQLPSGARHKHTDRSAARLPSLLPHRYASSHGHRHGHRGYGAHPAVAQGRHSTYPHTHAGAHRLAQRVGVGSHTDVRGRQTEAGRRVNRAEAPCSYFRLMP